MDQAVQRVMTGRTTQTLGTAVKPKNKAAKAKQEAWQGPKAISLRDSYFRGIVEAQRQSTGSATKFITRDTMFIGLPMPSLVMEYLFQMTVFPLSNLIQVSGPPSSGKTGLMVEFMRWFAMAGGGGHILDAELKISESWVHSILGKDDYIARVPIDRPGSMNAWQELLTQYTQMHQEYMIGTKEEPGPGRVIPVCFGVDSLVARSTDETQEKIAEDGSAGRGHPIEALSISKYFKARLSAIADWPFTIVVINHTMPKMDAEDVWDTREPGGEFVKFQQTYHLSCNKSGEIALADRKGKKVTLRIKKSGYGEGDRRARTRVMWRYVDEPDAKGNLQPMQVTWWDWDWAICDLLANLGKWDQSMLVARLKAHDIDFAAKSPEAEANPLAQCRALGMGKEEWLPYDQVGAMIHNNQDVRNRIRLALAIRDRPVLAGLYYAE